ncbi:MAG: hypothetical protein ACYDCK_11415 [Thermoplasmatota archaeon]
MRRIYALWFTAFALKLLGSAWDVSWHFRTEFDATSPAHITNAIGFSLLILALVIEWRNRTSERQGPLIVIGAGVALFLAAIPADLTWHKLFGVDLTTWSPTHLMLFYGTVVQIAGMLLLLLADLGWRPGIRLGDRRPALTTGEWVALGALAALFIEALAFPMGYNEYATVGAWRFVYHPETFSPDLLAAVPFIPDPPFAGDPHWLYPVYSVLIASFASVLFLEVTGKRGAALIPMAGYVLFRIVGVGVLTATGWPRGVIPYQFLLVGLTVELVWLFRASHRAKAVVAGGVAAAASYAWFIGGQRLPRAVAAWLTATPWLTTGSPSAITPDGAAFLAANRWVTSTMPAAIPITIGSWWAAVAAGVVGALLAHYLTTRGLDVVSKPRYTDFVAYGRSRWAQLRAGR